MPNSAFSGYNKLLSNMSVLYKNHAFVADEIWKPIKVKGSTGNWLKFDKTLYNLTDSARGTRQKARSVEYGWTNDVYSLQHHALSAPVYDDEADEVDGDVDLAQTTVEFLKEKLLLEKEWYSFGPTSPINSTSATNNSGYTSLDLTTPATDDWKTPLAKGAKTIELAAGVSPNVLVMHPDTMRAIVNTTQFQESVKYVLPTVMIGGIELPANLFGLPVKYVQAIANTANDGQTVSNARIMPDNIWMGYIAPQPMAKYVLTYGGCFWNQDTVTVERVLNPRSNLYIDEYNYVNQLIAPECGYLIQCTLPS